MIEPYVGFSLLTRSGCHLCETYAEQLAERFPEVFAALILKNVDENADWRARYGGRIPVLLRGETVVGEGIFDESAVRHACGERAGR